MRQPFHQPAACTGHVGGGACGNKGLDYFQCAAFYPAGAKRGQHLQHAAACRMERAMPFHPCPDTTRLAFDQHLQPQAGGTVVYLCGLNSSRNGTKAVATAEYAQEIGWNSLRFDYFGHGDSTGPFSAATFSRWRADVLAILNHYAPPPIVLVGSSMGAWLMALAARDMPAAVQGMVGIAAAPDFTHTLLLPALSEAQRVSLKEHGHVAIPNPYGEPYVFTQALLEDAGQNLALSQPHPFSGPVRLLHGLSDREVPWQSSLALLNTLASSNARLTLVKGGDHRLSSASDLALLRQALREVVGAVDA
jgi:pimeloyl-ACP methyl ester carboxylesterase